MHTHCPLPEATPALCWQTCCHSCLPGSCCVLSSSVNRGLAALPCTAYLKPLFPSKGRAFPAGSRVNHLQDPVPRSTHVILHSWPHACAPALSGFHLASLSHPRVTGFPGAEQCKCSTVPGWVAWGMTVSDGMGTMWLFK